MIANLLLLLAVAQTDPTIATDDMKKKVDEKPAADKPQGWQVGLSIGGTVSFNHSSNVVGQDDGATLQLGLVLGSTALYVNGQHNWENIFALQHAQSRTPQLERFVKSLDSIDLQSTYIYRFSSIEWLGPFLKATFLTSLLPGYAVRTTNSVVVRSPRDGGATTTETAFAKENIDLTGAFEPLTMRQTLGMFAEPLKSEPLTIGAKLGFGAQEVVVRDGYVIKDDAATPELEVAQLETTIEAGAEAELGLSGEPVAKVLTWKLVGNVFIPVASSVDADPDANLADKINAKITAGVSVKITDWLSLDYVLSALRVPAVLPDKFQVQNGLILNANFKLL
jgi:hypothetical protein